MEINIYSCSNQKDKITKQSETMQVQTTQQSYKESVPMRSDKSRSYDVLWLRR